MDHDLKNAEAAKIANAAKITAKANSPRLDAMTLDMIYENTYQAARKALAAAYAAGYAAGQEEDEVDA